MITYLIYHDCGKAFCGTIDDNGRRHFPDHANVSYHTWLRYGGSDDVSNLILHDMDLHIMKSGQELEFSQRPEACSLIISALCELHSNANMFGGIDSTSFKIKWKQIDKFSKRIISLMESPQ